MTERAESLESAESAERKIKRRCGECTLCCKTLRIADAELEKPAHQWCGHCTPGKGCGIYATRPMSCKVFECLWLQDIDRLLPDSLRPDKIGVVLRPQVEGGVTAHCDPGRPTAWRHPELLAVLRRLASAGYPVQAEAGNRFWIITGSTDWEVPPDCLEQLPNGLVNIRVPAQVKEEIGLYVRDDISLLSRVGPAHPQPRLTTQTAPVITGAALKQLKLVGK